MAFALNAAKMRKEAQRTSFTRGVKEDLLLTVSACNVVVTKPQQKKRGPCGLTALPPYTRSLRPAAGPQLHP